MPKTDLIFDVAAEVKDSVTVQWVLDDRRDDVDPYDIERLHYFKTKDIHKIIPDFSIGYMTRLHFYDIVSVEILVSTLAQLSDSPILYYNPNYKELFLILITDFQKHMIKVFPT